MALPRSLLSNHALWRVLYRQSGRFCARSECLRWANGLGSTSLSPRFGHPHQKSPSHLAWKKWFSSEGAGGGSEARDIDTADFAKLVADISKGGNYAIIDIREPEELVESGQIPGVVNIPLGDIEDALSLEEDMFEERYGISKPSLDADIVFSCRAGIRSLVAIELAKNLGYSRARHYSKGYLGWEEYLEEQNGRI